jgi:hypothetical protein
MEKEKVPQDDRNLPEGIFNTVKYALDKDGNYVKVPSSGWEVENIVLQEAWSVINEQTEEALKAVKAGSLSPIAYFMEKNMMDISLLADYTNFGKSKVRKHLIPATFKELKPNDLQLYADIFKITVTELLSIGEKK